MIFFLIVSILLTLLLIEFNNRNRDKKRINQEDFSSDEAIQNLASLYNSATMTVTNLNVTNGLNVNGSFNLLPKGIIVAWNGTTAPVGWALCNGQNGTPDLRDKFIMGMGTNAYKSIGGNSTVTLTANNLPPHNHPMLVDVSGGWANSAAKTNKKPIGSGESKSSNVTWATESNPTSNSPINILPPYYVLAYIMKM